MKFLLNDWRRLLVVFLVASFLILGLASAQSEEPVGSYRGELDVNQQNGVVIIGRSENPAICGDGFRDTSRGEQCDGSVNGNTCSSVLGSGFQGTLSCRSNCIYDTSECTAVPTNTENNNRNGGNGGSSSSGSERVVTNTASSSKECVENWECDLEWGACIGGTQVRFCTDKNNCGTIIAKPITERECENRLQIDNAEGNSLFGRFGALLGGVIGVGGNNASNGMIALFLLLIILGALLIINFIRRARLKENSSNKKVKIEKEE